MRGDDLNEIGTYNLQIFAKDSVSGIINSEAKFSVIALHGIQITEMPAEFKKEIVLKTL